MRILVRASLSAPLALAYVVPAAAAWAAEPEPPPIVITGDRGLSGAATVASVEAERLEETTAVITPEDSLRYYRGRTAERSDRLR